jgi:EAL domain-containing protein (putative c-di-GMP-specific phosphodiesterase class I)
VTLVDEMDRARRARSAIEELIADPAQLGPDFQPIRRLSDNGLVGWKATGRGKPGTDVADTLTLLQGAQSLGLVERLDWSFRCHAFDVAVAAGLRHELHITPEPENFGSLCPPRLAGSWSQGRRQLDVVAELHDDAFADQAALRAAVAEMTGWRWRLSVADLSQDRAAAAALAWLRPAYVQVALDAGRWGTAATRTWLQAAREVGAQVMATGADTPAALTEAHRLGASCARGALLGDPAELPH